MHVRLATILACDWYDERGRRRRCTRIDLPLLLLTKILHSGRSFTSCRIASITVQVLPVPGGPKMIYGTCSVRLGKEDEIILS